MVKIVMINGSPRINGATAQCLQTMQARLQSKPDTDVELIHLSELRGSACRGCCYCFQHARCIIRDDWAKLADTLRESDGVIIGSPTYASNISGQLKMFIDRAHLVMEQALFGQYAAAVITSENYGDSDAANILKKVISYSGASISATVRCRMPFTASPQLDSKVTDRLNRAADRLYGDIKSKRRYSFQGLKQKIIFQAGIKPFVLKKGEAYQGTVESWKKRSIHV